MNSTRIVFINWKFLKIKPTPLINVLLFTYADLKLELEKMEMKWQTVKIHIFLRIVFVCLGFGIKRGRN